MLPQYTSPRYEAACPTRWRASALDRRKNGETVLRSAFGKLRVVGHHGAQESSFGKPERRDEVDGVEGPDQRRENRLGLVENRLIERDERDCSEELAGGFKKTEAQGEAAQLDPQQAARNVLIEASELAQDGRSVGLAKQYPPESARVQIDGCHRSAAPLTAALGEKSVCRSGRSAGSNKASCDLF